MWKIKVDAEGKPVLDANGAAIFIKPDGTDFVADIAQMFGKITDLGRENADTRKRAETAEATLKNFEGIADPEAARKALQLAKDIKDGELISKGKVDEVREEIRKSFEGQISERDTKLNDLDGRYKNTLLSSAFNGSKFVTDKLILTPDLVQPLFRDRFKVGDDGKIQALAADGKSTVYSVKRPGEPADFDEALEMIVSAHPGRDRLLKGANQGGSGNQGGGAGNGGGKRTINRNDFDKLEPMKQAEEARNASKGLVEIVD